MAETLEQALDARTAEAAPALVRGEGAGAVRCLACGHRCLIRSGRRGICRLRFNRDGVLRVPRGYVAALQCDPIEKKPFFHALPGADALSFGMLGCDLHCSYCFPPGTRILTSRGHLPIEAIYEEARRESGNEAEALPAPDGLSVATHRGVVAQASRVFRHDFRGRLVRLIPTSLPAIEATPEHPFLAVARPRRGERLAPPRFVPAGGLGRDHLLALPRSPGGPTESLPGSPAEFETEDYLFVGLRGTETRAYVGPVYNLEVEGDHTYLANGIAVHNCQNWVTSQALRDPASTLEREDVTPAQLVDLAVRRGAPVVASTYNEPLITAEWGHEVFEEARRRGLVCAFISNGNATPEVLDYLRPLVDLYKVDLKAFEEKAYRSLGGTLENVLRTLGHLIERKFWVEVVTLTIPGFNDSEEQLRGIARFLAGLSRDIPWHVTAFHKDYRMTDPRATTARDLVRAAEIGEAEGLRFVYAGNLPGRVGKFEDTRCPACGATVVRRVGYRILDVALRGNDCRSCGARVPGVWTLPDGRSTWSGPTGERRPAPVTP
ncbi:MAG: radical SAM protein [Planctomycetales bacterium]|nr:radical SAM protein [Planctomycetales bacterium]